MTNDSTRRLLFAGALLGALGVGLGAFGAHWLARAVGQWELTAEEQTRRLETWEVAVRYQMYHALVLVAVGLLGARPANSTLSIAGVLFLAGVLIFSGCLYALVLTGLRALGAIVPLGGVCLIAGWIMLATAAFKG